MKIKSLGTGFTGDINVGRFSLFINVEKEGTLMDPKDIAQRASHFNRVVFEGNPFEQKEDLAKVILKVNKQSPKTIFEINTTGAVRPVKIGGLKTVEYNVHLQLKNSNIKYEERIRPDCINWFNEMGANFVFSIDNTDDMDEANMLINDYEIPKERIFLKPYKDDLSLCIKYAKKLGVNFTPKLREVLFNDGQDNN